MNMLRVIALMMLCFSNQAWADVSVEDAWVRLLPPVVKTTAAYMNLSSSQDDVLLSAFSPEVERVELHRSSMSNGVMSMDHIETIELKKGETLELSPGGYHLMLIGLKNSLIEGSKLPLTITFSKAGKVDLELPIRR